MSILPQARSRLARLCGRAEVLPRGGATVALALCATLELLSDFIDFSMST